MFLPFKMHFSALILNIIKKQWRREKHGEKTKNSRDRPGTGSYAEKQFLEAARKAEDISIHGYYSCYYGYHI